MELSLIKWIIVSLAGVFKEEVDLVTITSHGGVAKYFYELNWRVNKEEKRKHETTSFLSITVFKLRNARWTQHNTHADRKTAN